MRKIKRLLVLGLAVVISMSMSLPALAIGSFDDTQIDTSTESGVFVTDSGVYINGEYYTQEEFIQLLDTAQEMPQTRSAALVAGTWWIPGIGEVVVTAAGTIIIAGAIIEVGSWLYDAVTSWFADMAEQSDYEDAKENGEPAADHSTQDASEDNSLPPTSRPRSSKDLIDAAGVKQRRYYDKNGNADMDIDYRHGGVGHEFPHRHEWTNGKRGDPIPY